ncbi:recombinase RecT [Spiroplasma endosymbiont of Virgichneumon dumeticola]|uniref:recombinase RecT n=1 Tax=Spiroplasma endosymbiont of Virgichneumon dumeticola TaxID=3139323 RepID=UPI0035C8B33E
MTTINLELKSKVRETEKGILLEICEYETWFSTQYTTIDNLEIQKFKSNVLAISNQYGLDEAHPETIINSCYQAVLLNLPLEKNFGYCYVVPYWDNKVKINNAQFQMGYKGYIQLSLRSQQYKEINVSDVRLTEIEKVDRLKGIEFNWIQNDLERLKQPIIGYVAYFQLVNGFEKTLYMSKEQIEKHFLK